MGGPTARLRPPGDGHPGAGRRRCGAGVLACAARVVSPRPGRAAAGSPRPRMCWPPRPSPRTPARRRPWRRSGMLRTRTTPARRCRPSRPPTARRSPRLPRRSPTMRRNCWRSMTIRRALGASAHDQPPRVGLRDGKAPGQDHQELRPAGGGPGHGVPAHRSGLARTRAVNAPHLAALARAGARVERGQLVERQGLVA